jgi:hypothetical protein|nr:hypothetical protein [Kofleriaceae bacterium]
MPEQELDLDPPSTHAGWRWLVLVMGLWLASSAFFWPHDPPEATNTVIVGLAMAAVAFGGLFAPRVRYANTAIAVYLIATTILFAHASLVSAYNDGVIAALVFAASLVPSEPASWTGRTPAHHRA